MNPKLRFTGLLSHAGNCYGGKCPEDVLRVARDECHILDRVRSRIEAMGITVEEVSVGATPTVIVSGLYDGITEIRPGNYVFMDMAPLRMGLIDADRISLSVLATVVSTNQDYVIIDAGTKVLSSDLGAHGTGGAVGYGVAYEMDDFETKVNPIPIMKLSEEHGFLQRSSKDLSVGAKVRIIPNHSCPVANLADELTVVFSGAGVRAWKVDARGRVC
jgi:D-serine deaminase-like pyridoxal phosphate-dependent protein